MISETPVLVKMTWYWGFTLPFLGSSNLLRIISAPHFSHMISHFEDIIGELFIKNGYTLTDNNWYDGEGGDVASLFS